MSLEQPLVSVVVSNHNGKRLKILEECMDSVMELSYPNFEVIFVDNVSDDDSINFIKTKYGSRPKIIENNVNNYTRGLNLAINQSLGKYVFLVSNDAVVRRTCFDGTSWWQMGETLVRYSRAQIVIVQ